MNKTINVVLNKCFSILTNKSKAWAITTKILGQYNLNLDLYNNKRQVTLTYKSNGVNHTLTMVGVRENVAIEHKHGNDFTTYQLKNPTETGAGQFITEYHYNQLIK